MTSLAIAATTILAGAIIGVTTNAINGVVSPQYFQTIMRWSEVEHLWRATLAQGIFEGLIYGFVFSIVFTLVVAIVSKARCRYGYAMRSLIVIVMGVYGCWIIGGLIGMGLATLSPEFYRRAFYGVPPEHREMLQYAWVGGSIWGAMFGGILMAVIGPILFAVRWRRTHQGPISVTCEQSS